MSEANRVVLRYARFESDDTPITPAGDADELPFSSESLGQETDTVNSELIRDDRQIADHVRTNVSVSGDINFELLYAAFDDLFEAALQSVAWTTPNADITGSDIAASDSPNEFVSTTVSKFTGVPVGSVVRTSGFATAANNGYGRVTAVSTTTLTDDTLEVEKLDLTTEAAGAAVTFEFSGWITNGTRLQLFDFEREYKDLTSEFVFFDDLVIDQMTLDIATEAIMTGGFTFMGKTEASAAATFVSGTSNAAPSNPVFNAIDHVAKIVEGDVNTAFGQCVTAINMTLSNNMRERNCVGTLGPDSHGSGTVEVSGTLSMYYESKTIADKHLNFTTSELFIVLEDDNNQAYIIELPKVKYNTGPRGAGGLNQDIVIELGFAAFLDSALGYTIRIHRLA